MQPYDNLPPLITATAVCLAEGLANDHSERSLAAPAIVGTR